MGAEGTNPAPLDLQVPDAGCGFKEYRDFPYLEPVCKVFFKPMGNLDEIFIETTQSQSGFPPHRKITPHEILYPLATDAGKPEDAVIRGRHLVRVPRLQNSPGNYSDR